MADEKKTQDMARRIWLAGIGVYGKAFEEGKSQLEKLGGSTSETFDQLAEKGEKLQNAAKMQGLKLAGKASELREDIGVDDRISAMRERLSGAVPSLGGSERMDAVEARLESIEKKLDAVLKGMASQKRATTAKKSPAKKSAPKKPAAAKTPAAKKPAAKK